MSIKIEIQELKGQEITPHIPEMGKLRVGMFKEYPYLYEGSAEYEEEYLSIYANSPNSLILTVNHNNKIVGMLTGLRLIDWFDMALEPFKVAGHNPAEIYYIGEGMLLEEYRGIFSYTPLINQQEALAKQLGAKYMSFCAVNRPNNHPEKPTNYRSLTPLFKRLGYTKTNVIAEFEWTDVGDTQPTHKPMQFWLKPLP